VPKRYHNDWLKAFVEFASFGEAPLKNLFWTGVSTVAGALRRRVWIDQKYFQWIPNFYVIMVAPPGIVSKSTTANIGMNLLREVEEIKFGPDVITWQQLITNLQAAGSAEVNPGTGEFYPMAAVTYCSDELGNLLNPNDRDLIDALVNLWDGKRGVFKKETKTSGKDTIENPFVNIIGCTTPSWISGTFPEYLIGGGFTSRCVFVYADAKRQLVPLVDEVVPKEFNEMRQLLIHDLKVIAQVFGEFTISQPARDWNKIWYKQHWEHPPAELNTDQFAGYVARKQTHMFKLAMILSAAEDDSLTILARHLEAAAAMTGAIEADMPKVFSKIGQTEITRGSSIIIEMVHKNPGIPQTELYKVLFRSLSYRDFTEAIQGAINSHAIYPLQKGDKILFYPSNPPLSQDDATSKNTATGT
jgi:hypothetical protein